MNTFATTLACACIALAAGTANAMEATKTGDSMAADGMMKHDMTRQECKDHMAMARKDGMNRDDAMKSHDAMCSSMMKKGAKRMHKGSMHKDYMHKDSMPKDSMPNDSMQKDPMQKDSMKMDSMSDPMTKDAKPYDSMKK